MRCALKTCKVFQTSKIILSFALFSGCPPLAMAWAFVKDWRSRFTSQTVQTALSFVWYRPVGSGPRYKICVTFRVRLLVSHGSVFFESRNVQKHATESDTSGHCLEAWTSIEQYNLNTFLPNKDISLKTRTTYLGKFRKISIPRHMGRVPGQDRI